MSPDVRTDPLTGDRTHVVGDRQKRPNLPADGCPFCVGGLEAPEPYEVRSFPNRWPPLPPGRAEVVLYSPQHHSSLWELGVDGVSRVIDLWAERTSTLGALPDVDYVLVFENRGADVGATIEHPHGQIYAFDHIPTRPRRELDRPDDVDGATAELLVASTDGWNTWVPHASPHPYAVRIGPKAAAPDLCGLDPVRRRGLAAAMIDALERFDRLFQARTPYMMWIHQRPTDGGDWHHARLHIDIVTPWRASGLLRFVAAGELGSGEFFNPVVPELAAAELRAVR